MSVLQQHKDFASEVVALARKHRVSSVQINFRMNFDFCNEFGHGGDITASWSAGRHGDRARIGLQAVHHESIQEGLPGDSL